MDPTIRFLFYLAAAICFAIAAFAAGRAGRGNSIGFLPLGLLLWIAPSVWDAGSAAF
ncbi:MAG TPA: hypothetical protein VM938_01170 [Acidimicrobiales bacterium]|nr:hypothetical protein [Acidimicrobiales bacterium]